MKRILMVALAWLVGMQILPAKELTMEDVRNLAVLQDEIEWYDVAPYGGTDIGSGLYILSIPVSGQPYELWVGMERGPRGEIQYLLLVSAENSRSRADLWTEDMDAFLQWDHRIGRFRYDRIAEEHASGEPGVNPFPFQNVDAAPVYDYNTAVMRAREEVSIEYNAEDVCYDPEADVWQVTFFAAGAEGEIHCGGDQSVYLGSDGITRLIVYGE